MRAHSVVNVIETAARWVAALLEAPSRREGRNDDPLRDPILRHAVATHCTAVQAFMIRYGPGVDIRGPEDKLGTDLNEGSGWGLSTRIPRRRMVCQAHDGGGWEYFSDGPEGHEVTLVRTLPETTVVTLPGRPLSDVFHMPGDPGYVIATASVDRHYTRLVVTDAHPPQARRPDG